MNPNATLDYLISKYGPALTQEQLAEVLHRKLSGLRWSLCMTPEDPAITFIKSIQFTAGRRRYYPAEKVALLLNGAVGRTLEAMAA